MNVEFDLAATLDHVSQALTRALDPRLDRRYRDTELARELGLRTVSGVHLLEDASVLIIEELEQRSQAPREVGGVFVSGGRRHGLDLQVDGPTAANLVDDRVSRRGERPGMTILAVDGQAIDGHEQLIKAVGAIPAGREFALSVRTAAGETRTILLTLGRA